MYEDGLMHRVNIFSLERNLSNRVSKGQMMNSELPVLENVPCRIIKDSKVLFNTDIDFLLDGYVLEELSTNKQYRVCSEAQKSHSTNMLHHIKYNIEVKRI